jgi:hypothetical protein
VGAISVLILIRIISHFFLKVMCTEELGGYVFISILLLTFFDICDIF